MALTTGEFHEISLLPSTNAAWAALATTPSLPAYILDRVIDGATFIVYCIDAPTGWLAFDGGAVVGILDSVCNAVGAALSKQAFTATGGSAVTYTQDGSGAVYAYFAASGVLLPYTAPDVAAFKAWLP